jgi:acetyltransferase-like isoleucine patch superfamily enzyme
MLKRLFRMRDELSFGFYMRDFLFRRILRNNADTTWAVHHTSTIYNPGKIKRGIRVFPGDSPGVYINALNGLEIGDYSDIGPNAGILTANHLKLDLRAHLPSPPVVIGKYCWIGMGAIVLPGVTLGDFTVVGAGSVVTKSFPDGYCVIGGNPAKVIKLQNKEECDAFAKSKE